MHMKSIALGLAFVATAGLGYMAGAGAAAKKEAVMWAAPDIKWEPYAPGVPLQVAKLWGDRAKGKDYGMLLKLPAGMPADWHSHNDDYYGVSVQGTWQHAIKEGEALTDLPVGSYVYQPGKQVHGDACKAGQDCIVFIHQHAKGSYVPAKTAAAPAAPPAETPPPKPAAPATK
jgi:hypothetical protein